VTNFVQLLARRYRGRLDADGDEFVQYIVDGTTRMARLIEDLLDFSRAGTSDRPMRPIDTGDSVAKAVANLDLSIRGSGAVVHHDGLPTVNGDPTQLTQLFQNLIGNAIKYHGEAPPRVHVTAEPRERKAVFTVRDEGIGIANGSLEEIFQMFRRGDERAPFAGTGVGLAICRKVIERHGGRIWAEPAPGHGTAFRFTLPLADPATLGSATPGSAPATGHTGGRHAP